MNRFFKTIALTLALALSLPTATATTVRAEEAEEEAAYAQPSEDVYAFVERMYVNFLGRGSDPAGKENWAAQLASGQIDSVGFVRGFAYSDEFQNNILPYLSTDELIESFYNTFFDRASDEAGKENWTSKYDNWASLDYILAGFVNSAEWANLCTRFGITQGAYEGDPYNENLNGERLGAFVERFYTEALGRASEPAGKRHWATNIASGKIQPAELVYGFLGSVEFANRSENMTNEEFVDCMYHTFFDREPDQAGFAGWVSSLNNGTRARQDIIDGFVGSQEYINMVNSFFDDGDDGDGDDSDDGDDGIEITGLEDEKFEYVIDNIGYNVIFYDQTIARPDNSPWPVCGNTWEEEAVGFSMYYRVIQSHGDAFCTTGEVISTGVNRLGLASRDMRLVDKNGNTAPDDADFYHADITAGTSDKDVTNFIRIDEDGSIFDGGAMPAIVEITVYKVPDKEEYYFVANVMTYHYGIKNNYWENYDRSDYFYLATSIDVPSGAKVDECLSNYTRGRYRESITAPNGKEIALGGRISFTQEELKAMYDVRLRGCYAGNNDRTLDRGSKSYAVLN